MANYYETLGLSKNASPEQIKKAYRELAIKYHPDKNPGDPTAEAKFKEVNEAHQVLSDSQKRAQYDRFGSTGTREPQVSPNDIFDMFFGGMHPGRGAPGQNSPQKGPQLQQEIEVKLSEALFGAQKDVQFSYMNPCQTCNASGASEFENCIACSGSGTVSGSSGPNMRVTFTCRACTGSGKIPKAPCQTCSGSGRLPTRKDVSVNIPKGIRDRAALRLQDMGPSGINGGPPGDIILVVKMKYPDLNSLSDEDRQTLERILGT
jgi:molecular chaperone DnaJ